MTIEMMRGLDPHAADRGTFCRCVFQLNLSGASQKNIRNNHFVVLFGTKALTCRCKINIGIVIHGNGTITLLFYIILIRNFDMRATSFIVAGSVCLLLAPIGVSGQQPGMTDTTVTTQAADDDDNDFPWGLLGLLGLAGLIPRKRNHDVHTERTTARP